METTRIQKLIEHLKGTCKAMYEACTDLDIDEDDLSIEELEELDNEIFKCDECGWWYDAAEKNEGQYFDMICNDCNTEKEED